MNMPALQDQPTAHTQQHQHANGQRGALEIEAVFEQILSVLGFEVGL